MPKVEEPPRSISNPLEKIEKLPLDAPKVEIKPKLILGSEKTPRSISNPVRQNLPIPLPAYPLEADGVTPKYIMPSAKKIRMSEYMWAGAAFNETEEKVEIVFRNRETLNDE